jgi:hypothetical protein
LKRHQLDTIAQQPFICARRAFDLTSEEVRDN